MRRRWVTLTAIGFGFSWFLWADYSEALAAWFTERKSDSVASAGAWGDTFGPFTAAISTIGTVLVLMTLSAQRKAVAEQAKDLHKQRFESSYFELIKLLRELRLDLKYTYSKDFTDSIIENRVRTAHAGMNNNPSIKKMIGAHVKSSFAGKEAITAALVDARHYINLTPIDEVNKEEIGKVYTKFIQPRAEATFSPFFRIVYTILERLRRDDVLTNNDKEDYARLLRSQLSSHELSLIAINACAPISKDFSSLLIKFRMLKYHPPSKLDARIRKAYPEEAFLPRPEYEPPKGIREYLHL